MSGEMRKCYWGWSMCRLIASAQNVTSMGVLQYTAPRCVLIRNGDALLLLSRVGSAGSLYELRRMFSPHSVQALSAVFAAPTLNAQV